MHNREEIPKKWTSSKKNVMHMFFNIKNVVDFFAVYTFTAQQKNENLLLLLLFPGFFAPASYRVSSMDVGVVCQRAIHQKIAWRKQLFYLFFFLLIVQFFFGYISFGPYLWSFVCHPHQRIFMQYNNVLLKNWKANMCSIWNVCL